MNKKSFISLALIFLIQSCCNKHVSLELTQEGRSIFDKINMAEFEDDTLRPKFQYSASVIDSITKKQILVEGDSVLLKQFIQEYDSILMSRISLTAILNKITCLSLLGEYENAIDFINGFLLEWNEKYATMHFFKGIFYQKLNRLEKSREEYLEAKSQFEWQFENGIVYSPLDSHYYLSLYVLLDIRDSAKVAMKRYPSIYQCPRLDKQDLKRMTKKSILNGIN
jgi:tetratricopeptide (TPR) repeat protein